MLLLDVLMQKNLKEEMIVKEFGRWGFISYFFSLFPSHYPRVN